MDTGKWDTIYAVHLNQVNGALAQGMGQVPQTFALSGVDFLPYNIQGQFSRWSVIPGGSGQLIWLQLDIGSGTFTLGTGPQIQVAQLANVSIQVEVSLQLVPTQAGASALQFDFKGVGKPGQAVPGLVTPLKLLDPNKALNPAMVDALPGLIADFLVNNAARVTYVFASINPANASTVKWLEPVKSDYVYLQSNAGDGFLAILSATTDRDISTYLRQVDASLIAPGVQGFFVISTNLFMQNVVLPLLPGAWGNGASAASFSYNPANWTISNTGNLGVNGVQEGAITYYPQISSFSMVVSGGKLNTEVSGGCDLKMGMSMDFSISTACPAVYSTTSKTLAFQADPNPGEHHDTHIPWYDYLMGAIPDIIVAAVVPAIANGIASNLTSQLQNITVLNDPPQAVQWSQLGNMHVVTAGLAGALYLMVAFT